MAMPFIVFDPSIHDFSTFQTSSHLDFGVKSNCSFSMCVDRVLCRVMDDIMDLSESS